jgi:hypothetical protein
MSYGGLRRRTRMTHPLGSILLGTTHPARLRTWYGAVFGAEPNEDGFFEFGGVALLIDRRDDLAEWTLEPGRVILNFHVAEARTTAAHLDRLGVEWLVPPERRPDGWFGTLVDPDGNYVQIIELSAEYLESRGMNVTR